MDANLLPAQAIGPGSLRPAVYLAHNGINERIRAQLRTK